MPVSMMSVLERIELTVIGQCERKRLDGYADTVGPLLSGHPRDTKNWPLNRGNRGFRLIEVSNTAV